MIAFLGALKEEVSDLRRQMILEEVLAGPAWHLHSGEYRGREVLLAQTGFGRERAEAATRFILERYPITGLVSLGFAGALAGELEVGDVVICSTLHCAMGRIEEAAKPRSYCADDGLLCLATQALEGTAVRFCIGSGVTVPQLICSPEQKQELGKAFHAHIVDMESYWIARIASDQQIPFVAVRAVSDTRRDNLPPFDQMLTENGRWQWKKALSYFLRHPQHLTALLGLSRNVRRARRNLTTFADCLVAKFIGHKSRTF
jgi:adenosylhomocysteine nucleosidase